MARHQVRLLGGFRLVVDGQDVEAPAATQRIVSVLALRGRCRRGRLAAVLWPDASEARALASLRTAIWRANQLAHGLIGTAHDSVVLGPDVDVDITDLVQGAHAVMAARGRAPEGDDPGRASADPTRRAAQARDGDLDPARFGDGDLLPGWDDEWLAADRERLRQLRLHVLEARAQQLARCGQFGLALEAALIALRSDPLRESAHRTVIRIHLAEGNLAEALHAYAQCAAVLRRRLGVAPSAETSRLVAARAGAARSARGASVTMGA
ncbi:BTAD domain-containing putative transcriptional regulator [Cellulomonas cellasea]|uniref:AfsR/SARP family transcriptional regulator n=1 Tax=Cellulomonas cellasea TaxID=43670 RepID=UPI0025A37A6A|nr:BTAD domain-containing putative transcriptional regulator [Cellulomonas cellasea]MDM8086405.1 BTAD domain-containing putative transcriptional regulator [Cellulomonas cellasea]